MSDNRPTHCCNCGVGIKQPERGLRLRCQECLPGQRTQDKARWYADNRKRDPAWIAENKRRAKRWREKNQAHIREYNERTGRTMVTNAVTGSAPPS